MPFHFDNEDSMNLRFAIVSIFFAALCTPAVHAAPLVTFSQGGLLIRNVPPSGSLYVYGVSRQAMGTYSDIVPHAALLTDDDNNGIILWAPPGGVVVRSIYIVIDLTDGTHSAAIPAEYSATEVPLSAANLLTTGGVGATSLAFEGDAVHFLVVRAGVGAWQSIAGVSGDGLSQFANVAVGELSPVEELSLDPTPTSLEEGDFVLMINSFRAQYGVTRIGE
jgi:hypothetical protein